MNDGWSVWLSNANEEREKNWNKRKKRKGKKRNAQKRKKKKSRHFVSSSALGICSVSRVGCNVLNHRITAALPAASLVSLLSSCPLTAPSCSILSPARKNSKDMLAVLCCVIA